VVAPVQGAIPKDWLVLRRVTATLSPSFSIIIPTYNRLPFLKQALKSVWQQQNSAFEVIVVDDGSKDGTSEYLSTLGNQVIAITQHRRGPGAARNAGLERSRGDYVAFLDSDDVWFPWTLTTIASVIERADSPSYIVGKPFRFNTETDLPSFSTDPLELKLFKDYFSSGDEWRWWGVSSFVVKTSFLRSCGGFAEENVSGEDGDLALKLGDAPGFTQVISPYTFGYREHPSNLSKDFSKALEGAWLMVRRECANGYPGGSSRATDRRRILTRHIRPVILSCLKTGRWRDAWDLYQATFNWHLALWRWRFILGFPILALGASIRSKTVFERRETIPDEIYTLW